MKSPLQQKIDTIREKWSPIEIKNRRKTPLFLLTIHELSQGFQKREMPCIEDLVLIFNFDYETIKQTIRAMRIHEQLAKQYGTKEKQQLVLTEILALSDASLNRIQKIKEKVHKYEEWQVVFPRIVEYLQTGPKILYFPNQRRITYFSIREILKKIHPFLSKTVPLPADFAKLVLVSNITPAYTQVGLFSANELLAQILGFIDYFYRLQGDFIPFSTFQKILMELKRSDIHLEETKRKIFPYNGVAAKLFGSIPIEEYYNAVKKALQVYFRQFMIPYSIKSAILELIAELQRLRRFTRDPESHSLGLIGVYIEGFFFVENTKQYPIAPGLWIVGREQMHQIQRLQKDGVLKRIPPVSQRKPTKPTTKVKLAKKPHREPRPQISQKATIPL